MSEATDNIRSDIQNSKANDETVVVPPNETVPDRDFRNPFACPFYRVLTDGQRRINHVKLDRNANEYAEKCNSLDIFHHPVSKLTTPLGEVSIYTDIGGRRAQEDRFTFCSKLDTKQDSLYLGVFDGTVGDFASNNIKDLTVPHLLASRGWNALSNIENITCEEDEPVSESVANSIFPHLAEALDEMCLKADSELVNACSEARQDYASSTGVVAVVIGGCCGVAHLGDSRAALGHQNVNNSSIIYANFITEDHKPNHYYERNRIKHCGGSVEYLHNHNNKPFIRGGDFSIRKAKGEQPMQLQYSRAFGGKDLKGFGLSNEPDILCFRIEPWHRCLILASDGLWDVLSSVTAVNLAVHSRSTGRDPAQDLVNCVLHEQVSRDQLSDNITAVVLFFNTASNKSMWVSSSNSSPVKTTE